MQLNQPPRFPILLTPTRYEHLASRRLLLFFSFSLACAQFCSLLKSKTSSLSPHLYLSNKTSPRTIHAYHSAPSFRHSLNNSRFGSHLTILTLTLDRLATGSTDDTSPGRSYVWPVLSRLPSFVPVPADLELLRFTFIEPNRNRSRTFYLLLLASEQSSSGSSAEA